MNCVVTPESCFFFFQAEDGIRDLVRSRGLGDVYKRQVTAVFVYAISEILKSYVGERKRERRYQYMATTKFCLLYTSDAADDLLCVDLGGRRILK